MDHIHILLKRLAQEPGGFLLSTDFCFLIRTTLYTQFMKVEDPSSHATNESTVHLNYLASAMDRLGHLNLTP